MSMLLLPACAGTAGITTAPTTTVATTTLATIAEAATTTAVVTTLPPPTTSTTTTPPLILPDRFDPSGATIPELQTAMAEGRLTSVVLVRFYLSRITDFDQSLHAMLFVNPNAIIEAALLDRERRSGHVRGPLHGIPILLKDNIGTGDMPTTAGSLSLDGFIPSGDATQVARLRAAGAIILGKTNLHEFARDITTVSSLGGQTRNPYDTSRYPGGSSGGTGAALAAEFAAAGLGTDTCGSIRIPAAFNHLYGLRPTIGLTPVDGVIPLTFTEDTVGPMARSVVDLAIVLDATADSGTRYADAAATGSLDGIRIGVVDDLFAGADPAVSDAIRIALDLMAAGGAEVVAAPMPGFDDLRGNAASVFLMEWRTALDEYLAGQPGAPMGSMAEIVASGQYHPSLIEQLQRALSATLDTAEYRSAVERRQTVRTAIEDYLAAHDLDALAYPTMTQPPALIGTTQRGSNCGTASVGGLPAIVVPAGFTPDHLPVGLELMGASFAEETLIGIAAGYERVAPGWVPPDL
jgi:Asp-tRNA(Asn)/Glu-tRNA(Gln) amidotransferase A subunit family amidase